MTFTPHYRHSKATRTLAFLLAWGVCAPLLAQAPQERVFRFTYEVLAAELPRGAAIDMYIPLPLEGDGQRILDESLQASLPGSRGEEPVYGNRYYRISRPAESDEPLTATLSWTIARSVVGAQPAQPLTPAEQALYLAPNALVPVGHEVLDPILQEIQRERADTSTAATARAIYDWVVDNVEYKKVGTGWGNGDTFWACSERYGNCTDFHALFISLARTEQIPARFEIGFPVPDDRSAGSIGGYHCWVRMYLPQRGWVPIDASEAAKHPQRRELLYGTQPADRIHFTTGRDLVISAGSREQPLNYFVYPYIEIDGQPWTGRVPTRFSFEDVADIAIAAPRQHPQLAAD